MSTPNPGPDRPPRALPERPDLRHLKDEAKRRLAAGEFASLAGAQFAVAREHGFASWPRLKQFVEARRLDRAGRAAALVRSACSGDLRVARELLRAEADLARHDLWTACACGERDTVAAQLSRDPAAATRKGGPLDREPILYACFSRFLRGDADRAGGVVQVVRLLLDHGADPNSYYLEDHGGDKPLAQHCIYAAAGIANNARLTRMLLDAGAAVSDPALAWNDPLSPANEVVYHAAEHRDTECLEMILARAPKGAIDHCIGRALDYEHSDAIELFLKAGADPNNRVSWKGARTQAHKAVVAGRSARVVEMLLDHGADPNARDAFGVSMYRSAVRLGQHETAALLAKRGADTSDVTEDDVAAGELMAGRAPARAPKWIDPHLLAEAAANDNLPAVRRLLDAGADVNALGGFQTMTPLHWACWKGNLEVAEALIERGADLRAKNQYGGDALGTAIHGSTHCFDEGGTGMKLPEEVPPRGYAEIVKLLVTRGATLPAEVGQASEPVREVLRGFGVKDREDE